MQICRERRREKMDVYGGGRRWERSLQTKEREGVPASTRNKEEARKDSPPWFQRQGMALSTT